MINLSIFISLCVLFYLLCRAADLTIVNVRKIGEKLGIKLFFLGLILGFFTSLPELAVGINALASDVQEISLGNLLGGIIVLFGLILGISSILNRRIFTGGQVVLLLPVLLFLFLPLLLGLNGKLNLFDGAVLILLYFLILYFQYIHHRNINQTPPDGSARNKVFKRFFYAALGLALVVVISNLIIRFTLILLNRLEIPHFIIGLILFALGTNLPEIIVSVRSWRRNIKELSLSNLIGSAMANVFLIGIFSFIKPLVVNVNLYYYILIAASALLFICLSVFYKTKNRLSRNEGIILIIIYLIFLATQTFLVYYL